MSEYRKELEKYLTMPNAHINCAENTSMALTDALGIGGGRTAGTGCPVP